MTEIQLSAEHEQVIKFFNNLTRDKWIPETSGGNRLVLWDDLRLYPERFTIDGSTFSIDKGDVIVNLEVTCRTSSGTAARSNIFAYCDEFLEYIESTFEDDPALPNVYFTINTPASDAKIIDPSFM